MDRFAPILHHAVGASVAAFLCGDPLRCGPRFDEDGYRALRLAAWHGCAGLFAAGGTGEFFSLTPAEVERVVAVAVGAMGFGVIVYNRDNAILQPETLAPLGERRSNLLGCPRRRPSRSPISSSASTYSSAIFNFMLEWASFFDRVVRARSGRSAEEARRFRDPIAGMRNRERGYAVAIVKAGTRAIGRPAGPVHSPLHDLSPAELAQLTALIGQQTI